MRFNRPRGYLLTWSTYGTHLHGDQRGSIDRKGTTPKTKFLGPDEILQRLERGLLQHEPFVIIPQARRVIRLAIEDACTYRQWKLHAANIRSEHVHVVVSAPTSSTRVLHALKSRATRLLRESALVRADQSPWSEGGSRRELYLEQDVLDAIHYVRDGQGHELPEA